MGTGLLFDELLDVHYNSFVNNNEMDRGAIFTKPEVVSFMLDLIGYTVDQPLATYRILEPSLGSGEFLIEIASRLLESQSNPSAFALKNCIQAVEIHGPSIDSTRERLKRLFYSKGIHPNDQDILLDSWLLEGDFLLKDFEPNFTHIVGNPPYIRQEAIPVLLLQLYKDMYQTVYDRADLYVPFIERCLQLLSPKGKFSFICSDRWMKNKYGVKLRDLIAANWDVVALVDMVGTEAFFKEVTSYPSIFLIQNIVPKKHTAIAKRPTLDPISLQELSQSLQARKPAKNVTIIKNLISGGEPWLFDHPDALAVIREIESKHPKIEDAGCKVGIGVATGADKVFIDQYESLDVEPSRKLPLATTKDLQNHRVVWRGSGIINPFDENGCLVDLDEYPKLKTFLNMKKGTLCARHVARKNPQNWYRTIDKIDTKLLGKPKLLIPDIKGAPQIALEPGELYPHHNLYFILSHDWDIRALQNVLLSGIARLFVEVYSTKMRGGYLRYQAQYLRRICIPPWSKVSMEMRGELINVQSESDRDQLICRLYQLDQAQQQIVRSGGQKCL